MYMGTARKWQKKSPNVIGLVKVWDDISNINGSHIVQLNLLR
jgi:hypothetical protein